MKRPRRIVELQKIANDAKSAMLGAIDDTINEPVNDMEYGYIISRILLSLSHTVCRLLDYEEEELEE